MALLRAPALVAAVWPAEVFGEGPVRVHLEVDPLPFALKGYRAQVGYRPLAESGLRFAVASFALEVPDLVAELGGNDGFHLRVRPSFALYLLYYLSPSADGLAVGGALRW